MSGKHICLCPAGKVGNGKVCSFRNETESDELFKDDDPLVELLYEVANSKIIQNNSSASTQPNNDNDNTPKAEDNIEEIIHASDNTNLLAGQPAFY